MAGNLPETGLRCLFFQAGGQRFALEISSVEGIIPPRTVVPAPLAPPFIDGLINLRGRVVTMLRLPGLLNLPGAQKQSEAVVVLRRPDLALAFGVEELLGIASLETGTLGELVLSGEAGPPGVRATVQHEGFPVNLLDLDQLVSCIMAYDYQGAGETGARGRI